jgi:hypothetical protein
MPNTHKYQISAPYNLSDSYDLLAYIRLFRYGLTSESNETCYVLTSM